MALSDLIEKLELLKTKAEKVLKEAFDQASIEIFISEYLGKKSEIQNLFKTLKDLSPEEKKEAGPVINTLRDELQKKAFAKRDQLEQAALEEKLKTEWLDVTKNIPSEKGSLHPISHIQREIERIFTSMGFQIADGPMVETEWNNFDALNIESDHPARDMQDTFFVQNDGNDSQKNTVLRTHTSNIQIRTLKEQGAPLKIIAPGRVFRNEALDATHDAIFYQVEGMMVDKGINLSHLKGVIQVMLDGIFEKNIKTRIRPGYFPFVEPGLEIDIWWEYIDKDGVAQGKWLEFMGAGMIHPNVLTNGGVDPNEYSGFAFGFGLTRLAMMKYGIEDIRLLFSLKKDFLTQF